MHFELWNAFFINKNRNFRDFSIVIRLAQKLHLSILSLILYFHTVDENCMRFLTNEIDLFFYWFDTKIDGF